MNYYLLDTNLFFYGILPGPSYQPSVFKASVLSPSSVTLPNPVGSTPIGSQKYFLFGVLIIIPPHFPILNINNLFNLFSKVDTKTSSVAINYSIDFEIALPQQCKLVEFEAKTKIVKYVLNGPYCYGNRPYDFEANVLRITATYQSSVRSEVKFWFRINIVLN